MSLTNILRIIYIIEYQLFIISLNLREIDNGFATA